jgi:carotenoid cleavage dioxygenase-like enzyme
MLMWNTEAPCIFYMSPRKPSEPLAGSGWAPYEHRIYTFPHSSEIVHTAGAWEENGKIKFEGTWPHDSLFPFWPRSDHKDHAQETRVDLVRFTIDPALPHKTQLENPDIILDIPNEFPRIDERFYNKPYDHIFMNIFHSEPQTAMPKSSIWQGLNATAMLVKSTGKLKVYSPGPQCQCQEPVFIPRSNDVPEGDGHVLFAVDRLDVNVTNVVLLDTKDFENPVAVVELPLRMRVQIHGNWVDASELNEKLVEDPSIEGLVWRHEQTILETAAYAERLVKSAKA